MSTVILTLATKDKKLNWTDGEIHISLQPKPGADGKKVTLQITDCSKLWSKEVPIKPAAGHTDGEGDAKLDLSNLDATKQWFVYVLEDGKPIEHRYSSNPGKDAKTDRSGLLDAAGQGSDVVAEKKKQKDELEKALAELQKTFGPLLK